MDQLITKLEEMLNEARPSILTGKTSIDRNEFYDVIDRIRAVFSDMERDLPNEITQARRVVMDREKVLTDAQSKARQIIAAAEADAEQLIDEHVLVRRAQERALQILDENKTYVKQLRQGTKDYIQGTLGRVEEIVGAALKAFNQTVKETEAGLTDLQDEVYENRRKLDETL